ncbi:hypothetical protein [Streptomyces sp. NPDC001315]|uniref:hypothetical protein n=1 Tax=Streptomyces sp. NPDC001315 TaxID=3364562 RepID=UPI0036A1367C
MMTSAGVRISPHQFPQRQGRGVVMAQWTRREDERLLTGKGRYVADIDVPGCLDAAFVRSKVAHGLLRAVGCRAARDVPGVVGAPRGHQTASRNSTA